MSTAATQLNRMASLVAELNRRRSSDEPAVTFGQLAELFSTTAEEIQADIRRLTFHDSSESEWLLSLQLLVEGDRVEGGSGGPFRRPMRLTPDESLVFRLSLGMEDPAAAELLDVADHGAEIVQPFEPSDSEVPMLERILSATRDERCVDMDYATAGSEEFTTRTIHPYQVVVSGGRTYVVGWCDLRSDWRRFRLDRILELRDSDRPFSERDDCPYDDIFQAEEQLDQVRVRFSPEVARWMVERYPVAVREEDGSAVVTYEATSVDWMVERVLQYGVDAEVIEPAWYRGAVQKAVS